MFLCEPEYPMTFTYVPFVATTVHFGSLYISPCVHEKSLTPLEPQMSCNVPHKSHNYPTYVLLSNPYVSIRDRTCHSVHLHNHYLKVPLTVTWPISDLGSGDLELQDVLSHCTRSLHSRTSLPTEHASSIDQFSFTKPSIHSCNSCPVFFELVDALFANASISEASRSNSMVYCEVYLPPGGPLFEAIACSGSTAIPFLKASGRMRKLVWPITKSFPPSAR